MTRGDLRPPGNVPTPSKTTSEGSPASLPTLPRLMSRLPFSRSPSDPWVSDAQLVATIWADSRSAIVMMTNAHYRGKEVVEAPH